MALTLAPGQRVSYEDDLAEATLYYATDSDIPDVGDAQTWVDHPGTWYCARVEKHKKLIPSIRVIARQPGRLWTAYGLAPISAYGRYTIQPAVTMDPGGDGTAYNFDNWFSNWDDALNWDLQTAATLMEGLVSWQVEWVDATDRSADMLDHKNGTWPTGFAPAVATAGAYLCRHLRSEYDPVRNHSAGTVTDRFRHWGTFWQAPIVDSVQMLWRNTSW